MRKQQGIVLILLGFFLIGCALFLRKYNLQEDTEAKQSSAELLKQVQSVISLQPDPPPQGPSSVPPLTVAAINGYEYIGYLSIPDIDVVLPVMSDWDYRRLKLAPCRQFGSAETANLVIAAHNYKSHFGYLFRLNVGAPIQFTNAQGTTYHYTVAAVKTLSPQEVDAVQNSGYPLVLYTCTPHGATRVVVFCR